MMTANERKTGRIGAGEGLSPGRGAQMKTPTGGGGPVGVRKVTGDREEEYRQSIVVRREEECETTKFVRENTRGLCEAELPTATSLEHLCSS